MERTYVFEGDEVYAMEDGQVLASAPDADELEEKLAGCQCKGDCKCGKGKKASTHIITPGGLKGKILGHVEDVWGEGQVTVRLENGRIAHVAVADAEYVEEDAPEFVNPIVRLEEVLDESTTGTREDLAARQEALSKVKTQARDLILKGASVADAARLDQISVTADYELNEIGETLDHLNSEEAEAFEPPAPFGINVVEQGGNNRGSEWLDATLNEMIDEAENYDYDKLLDEGPEAFVAGQDEGVLADQGATQAIAASFIRSKTAAADPVVRDKYEGSWLARVEELRRTELDNRKTKAKKEAAEKKDETDNAPDDSLFL
jgi:hypothetical protein